jgi:hypothetical protein
MPVGPVELAIVLVALMLVVGLVVLVVRLSR